MTVVADAIVEQLAGWGVTHVFGVSGANIELVFDCAARHGQIDVILAKHEAAATMMAIGYQQRSGLLGVVLTTSGGGAFNIVAPLTEALESRVPLVAIVGQTPAGRDGTGAFQDSSGEQTPVDAERIFAAVSVACIKVGGPAVALPALREAAAAALSHGGPAVVLLPRDVQSDDAGAADPHPLTAISTSSHGGPGADVLRVLRAAVDQPAPPLLIAGPGVVGAGAQRELVRLAACWGSPIAVTPDAKSAISSDSPSYLGVAGVMGHARVTEYAARASVCVLVGTRLPDVAVFGLDEPLTATSIVNLGNERCFPELRGHPAVHNVPGELSQVLEHLRTQVVPSVPRIRRAREDSPRRSHEFRGQRDAAISSEVAIEILARHLGPGADVFIDAGNAGAFAVHHLPSHGHGLISVALGMGAMGHAFGASIGAAVHTRRRTYVIAGDGAFYMHGLELHTAREYALPITYLILNNNAHAMCRLREELLLTSDTGTNVFAPAHLAEGVGQMLPGIDAREVDSPAQLERAFDDFAGAAGPVFLSINVPADEQPPFWPLARTTEKVVT